jgi:hypothetical protein
MRTVFDCCGYEAGEDGQEQGVVDSPSEGELPARVEAQLGSLLEWKNLRVLVNVQVEIFMLAFLPRGFPEIGTRVPAEAVRQRRQSFGTWPNRWKCCSRTRTASRW